MGSKFCLSDVLLCFTLCVSSCNKMLVLQMVCGVYRFQMKEKMWKTPCKRRQISLFIGKVMKNGMQFKVFFLIYINLFSIFELF